jgi:hypothetical protein
MLPVNEDSFKWMSAHSILETAAENAMHAPAAPTLAPRPAAATTLSPEEVLRLELSGLSSREIRRLLFVRWLHAAGRLVS